MVSTTEQMKVFGYTPEGLDQEVEKYTSGTKKDFKENKLEEERRANHPLNNIPFFERPMNASTDDVEIPTSDSDVRAFKNKFGETYTIATSKISTYEDERKKLRDGIISSIEGIKGYLKDPSLPSKEQVVDFVKGAAVGTLEEIKQSMSSGASYGDIFGMLAGVGAASTPFKVPGGKDSLRIFGGPGAPDYKNEAYYKALQLKRRGYTDKQIEEITGRFRTSRRGDYIPQVNQRLDTLYYNKDFLNSRTRDVNNKDIIEKELKAIEAEIAQLEKKYPGGLIDPKEGSIFKFEIPDNNIKIKTNNGVINYKEATVDSPILVGDLIPTHKKLFEQYPNLKDVEFYIDPEQTAAGVFNPFGGKLLDDGTGRRTGSIAINPDLMNEFDNINSKEFRDMFFHELQHAVQHQDYLIADLEQLAGSPTSYTKTLANENTVDPAFRQATILKNPKALKIKEEIVALFKKEYPSKFKWVEEDFSVTDEGLKNINPKVAKKLANLMRDLELESHRTYLQTASEVEASVVGLRASKLDFDAAGPVTPEISKRKNITTVKEYSASKDAFKVDNQVTKIIKNIKSKFKPMNEFEQMKYHGAAVYFARYALGMDADLQQFDLIGVARRKGTVNSPPFIKPTSIKPTEATLEDYGYYQDNPATKGREGGEDWVKKQQRYAEEDAARGGSGATKKFFNGPITANLGGMDNNKPLFLDSKFLASLKGANNEVRDASDSKYKELLKDAQDGGFDPDQKGNKVVVGVNHKGEAYIIEGNTRAAVASELGIPSVKVEVRYWNGAETVDGPYSPQNILKYASKKSKNFAEGGMAEQMEMFGYTAEGAQQEADKFVEEAGDLETDISKAASFVVPFYDSGVNIANVAQEYMKPEQERDYEYIKDQFREAGQSAAIEGGLLLMGGVAGKYGAKGIKALADKVKQYEIDPTAVSAFGAGAIRKKPTIDRAADVSEAERLIDDPDALKAWQETEGGKGKRQENPADSEAAAEALYRGDITSKEARKRVGEAIPPPKEYTADEVRKMMPTVTDVTGAMGKKARDYGILGVKGFDLKEGQLLGTRLDIPAYNKYDKWVVSIHDGGTKEKINLKGSVLGYGQAIRLKNVRFGSQSKEALDIARGKILVKKTGKEKPFGKSTIARAVGEYVPEDPYKLQEMAASIIESGSKEWTQVGMNPYRGSQFYDKKTGKIIFDAEEMIQVGPLVLAKNAKVATISDLKEMAVRTKDGKLRMFNEGGVSMNKQMQMAFMNEGGLTDDGMDVDPVSFIDGRTI